VTKSDKGQGRSRRAGTTGPPAVRRRPLQGVSAFGALLLLLGVVLGVDSSPAVAASPWTATTLPAPAGGPPGSFSSSTAVSCPAEGSCLVAGSYVPVGNPSVSPGGGSVPYVDTLSVDTVTTTVLPIPPGASQVGLSSISCLSAASCVAVGEYSPPGGGVRPLAEVLADGSWADEVLPEPARACSCLLHVSPVPILGSVS
jgi:hypothetical protein